MKQGPAWPSFKALRVRHAEQLAEVKPGHYATLLIRKRRYVILNREDFDRIQEDMQAMVEIADALKLVSLAAGAASVHQDEATIRTLDSAAGLSLKVITQFLDRRGRS